MSLLLIAGVQMYTQSDDRCDEGITFYSMKYHAVKPVIIEDAIVNPFGTGTFFVYLLVFLSSPGYRRVETNVPVWFCIYHTTICRR